MLIDVSYNELIKSMEYNTSMYSDISNDEIVRSIESDDQQMLYLSQNITQTFENINQKISMSYKIAKTYGNYYSLSVENIVKPAITNVINSIKKLIQYMIKMFKKLVEYLSDKILREIRKYILSKDIIIDENKKKLLLEKLNNRSGEDLSNEDFNSITTYSKTIIDNLAKRFKQHIPIGNLIYNRILIEQTDYVKWIDNLTFYSSNISEYLGIINNDIGILSGESTILKDIITGKIKDNFLKSHNDRKYSRIFEILNNTENIRFLQHFDYNTNKLDIHKINVDNFVNFLIDGLTTERIHNNNFRLLKWTDTTEKMIRLNLKEMDKNLNNLEKQLDNLKDKEYYTQYNENYNKISDVLSMIRIQYEMVFKTVYDLAFAVTGRLRIINKIAIMIKK